MTYFAHHRSQTELVLSGLQGLTPGALLATFRSWNDARITRNALNALSDRELSDIGLARSDIDAVANRNS
ncbi:MAG: DUF1127 domain-containing protein [Rhodobacteraceae bacterium]|nr:MAG: DUF1127 domain-containing protein [Paracoccaceae bacterium]